MIRRQHVDRVIDQPLAGRLDLECNPICVGLDLDGGCPVARRVFLGFSRDLDRDGLLLSLAARADQRNLLLAIGRSGRTGRLHRLLGLHCSGESFVGPRLSLRLLFRFGRNGDRFFLVGDLDRLLALDSLNLNRALRLDRLLLDLPIAIDFRFLYLALGVDPRLRGFAILLRFLRGDQCRLLRGAEFDLLLLVELEELLLALNVELLLLGVEVLLPHRDLGILLDLVSLPAPVLRLLRQAVSGLRHRMHCSG